MCGLIAAIDAPGALGRVEALARLRPRGPDATEQWSSADGRVWCGHTRLAIVDLSAAGNQPMHSADGRLTLVCNGEIYNYPTLRRHLEARGHMFRSRCDSEVVLHAYREWGAACIERLEGMFALCLWDRETGHLLAARDRVGIKPLYYAGVRDGLVLASDAGALRVVLGERLEPDPVAVAYAMTIGYVPAPHCIWAGVRKLPAGHVLTWSRVDGARVRRYWSPPAELDGRAEDGEFAALWHDVLREHLLADVPLGLFLSGGIDSTAVALGLCDIGRRPAALTVAFPGSGADEAPIAAEVAAALGLEHRALPLKTVDVDPLLREAATAFDEPQGYSALLSMKLLARLAADPFKVVLAGDGGDEVFGGYKWYDKLEWSASEGLVDPGGLAAAVERDDVAGWHLAAAVRFAQRSPLHRHARRLYPRFLPEEAAYLLSPHGTYFNEALMLAPFEAHYVEGLPLRRALQRVDLMTFCSDSILPKVDRASMAHGLEVRVPLLDRRIIEWGLSRPLAEREAAESKAVLRDYLRGRVPGSVLAHPKQGFSLRVLDCYDWDAAVERISAGWWVRNGWFANSWRKFVAEGVPYRTGRIWNLLMLTEWANAWLEPAAMPSADEQATSGTQVGGWA